MTTVSNSAATLTAGWRAGLARRAAAAPLACAAILRRWWRRERDLRHVLQLDDHLLRDVGLTRDQVARGVLQREAWQWRG
ncbi:MAG: DUF1127 domain-containing protein [Bacteroidota bacterium]|nr:DUF1127 domain-containing protein [Kiloniellaceae bacterium]